VKSAGKNFGMEIVWYVALLGQVAPVQAADEEKLIVHHRFAVVKLVSR